jgi:hypothetical protein
MTTSELAERYEELHGQPVRTRHRAYLIRKIAWRIQAIRGHPPISRAIRGHPPISWKERLRTRASLAAAALHETVRWCWGAIAAALTASSHLRRR